MVPVEHRENEAAGVGVEPERQDSRRGAAGEPPFVLGDARHRQRRGAGERKQDDGNVFELAAVELARGVLRDVVPVIALDHRRCAAGDEREHALLVVLVAAMAGVVVGRAGDAQALVKVAPRRQGGEQGVVLAAGQGGLRQRENVGGQRRRLVGPEQGAERVGGDGQIGVGEVADVAVKRLLLEGNRGACAHEQGAPDEHFDAEVDEARVGRDHPPRKELERRLGEAHRRQRARFEGGRQRPARTRRARQSCDSQGEGEAGDTQTCCACGSKPCTHVGVQTCKSTCSWGACADYACSGGSLP